MAEWKDILSDDENLSDDELLRYLSKGVDEQERRDIEEKAAISSFDKDALEGLQQLKSPEAVQHNVQRLKRSLRNQLTRRNGKKSKAKLDLRWSMLAVLLILFFCILAYIVLRIQRP